MFLSEISVIFLELMQDGSLALWDSLLMHRTGTALIRFPTQPCKAAQLYFIAVWEPAGGRMGLGHTAAVYSLCDHDQNQAVKQR